MKTFIICGVPAQIPYLGRFLFQRYGPKCSQPVRLQKFLSGHGQKWAWPVWSWESKIDCISRMN